MNQDQDNRHVLIVDDDAGIRTALRDLLETEGYLVSEAANGLAALGRLRSGLRPGVILLDLMMPVMDGWDLRTEQLRDPELSQIPIVVITAAGFSAESLKTQFGPVPFFPKPPEPDRLLAAVGRLCERRPPVAQA